MSECFLEKHILRHVGFILVILQDSSPGLSNTTFLNGHYRYFLALLQTVRIYLLSSNHFCRYERGQSWARKKRGKTNAIL